METITYIDTIEAARILGRKPRAISRLCKLGKIPNAQKQFGQWRIPEKSIILIAAYF